MSGYTFHLIPHTHWDREWYLPHSVLLPRLVTALDDLLARLAAEPELTFLLDGQTVLIEDYLQVRPERTEQVSDLVRAGRLQIGPWYVLADELIPSGESLIRNLLEGRSDAARLGGRTDVLYSPDAFGHPAVWPQLAGEFGIRFGVLWRGLGGEPGQQHDFYRWRGPDGREVLLYHLPRDGYEAGAGLPADAERLPRAWARIRSALLERAATRQVAVFVGADHHAIHPGLVALRGLLSQLEPASDFRISRLADFFAAAAIEATGAPVITGELRWSYGYTWTLQGVHATRAPLKRKHAITELTLTGLADPLVALVQCTRGSDRRALLKSAWRLLLQSEFHDSIGGCTSDVVAQRVEARLDDARSLGAEIVRSSLQELVGNDPDRVRDRPEIGEPQMVLWNPVPRRRRGVILADLSWFRRDVLVGPPSDRIPRAGPGFRSFHLIGASEAVPVQLLGTSRGHERMDALRHYPDQDEVDWSRVAFHTSEIGGMGVASLAAAQGARPARAGVWVEGRRMGNGLVEVRVGRAGSLELIDQRGHQRYGNVLELESSGDIGDTYTYAPPKRDRVRRTRAPVEIRVLARGPLVGALELRSTIQAGRRERGAGAGAVAVRVVVSLYADSLAVRCTVMLVNQALNHRLRARVPTGLSGGPAIAGGPFGTVSRPAVSTDSGRYPRERPVTTAPAHRFVARASKNRGLALLAPGFFEYELTPQGDLLVTLLRSVGQLSLGNLSTRPGHAGWPIPTPAAQCLGSHRIQLAIVPVTESQLDGGTTLPRHWEDLFLPIQPVWLRQASPLSLPDLDIRLEGEGLVFSSLKPASVGPAIVLRCYNATSSPAAGTWHFSVVVAEAHRARADEQILHEIRLGEGSRSIPFHAAPHEIVTIMVRLEGMH
jgi:mannosylglycerate hydrolase